MSRESKATKDEIQRNRAEAYQNGWGDGYAEGYGKAAAAMPAQGVRVKPLEWFEVERGNNGYGKWTAEGYTVRKIEGLFLLDFAGNGKNTWRFITSDAAKAAAQADYAARIMAAVDAPDVAELAAMKEQAERDRQAVQYANLHAETAIADMKASEAKVAELTRLTNGQAEIIETQGNTIIRINSRNEDLAAKVARLEAAGELSDAFAKQIGDRKHSAWPVIRRLRAALARIGGQ